MTKKQGNYKRDDIPLPTTWLGKPVPRTTCSAEANPILWRIMLPDGMKGHGWMPCTDIGCLMVEYV